MNGHIPSSEMHTLFRNRSRVRSRSVSRPELGFLYIVSVPIIAVVSNAFEFEVAGFHISGWFWAICWTLGLFVLLFKLIVHRSEKTVFPYVPWLVWFGYVWCSLLWGEYHGRAQIQEAVQISMPLLIGVLASSYVRTEEQLKTLLNAFCYGLIPAYVIVGLAKSHKFPALDPHNPEDPFGTMAPMGMTLALISCIYLVQIREQRFRPWFGWGAGLLLTFVTGARTVTATMLLLAILNPAIKRMSMRVILVLVAGGLGLVLFHTPWFQTRFFFEGTGGTLADLFNGDFDSSGRFDAWPLFWDEAWHHPVFGDGAGTVVSLSRIAWPDGTVQVHNDYLAIFFEFGLVGLAIFVSVMFWQTVRLWHEMTHSDGLVQRTFAAAFLGVWVFLLNACTDNPLAYNLGITDPLFALIGAAYGVAYASDRSKPDWNSRLRPRSDFLVANPDASPFSWTGTGSTKNSQAHGNG